MKKLIVGVVALMAVAAAGTAGAVSSQWKVGRVACKSQSVGGEPTVLCIPMSARGFGVAINKNFIVVVNSDTGKTVFSRDQP